MDVLKKPYLSQSLYLTDYCSTMRKIFTLLPFLMLAFLTRAQDIHFTQYNMAPVALNPAFTGAFNGTFRIGAIYRTQWFNVDGFNSFKTPDLYIDAPIIKGFRDNDWVGVGLNIFQDEAGALELTFGSFLGSVAYHLGLNKDASSTLTLGVQGGFVSRSLANATGVDFEDDMETLDNAMNGINYFDLNAGVVFRSPLGANSLFEAGFAAFHLTGPDYGLQQGNDKLPLRYDIHARLKNYLTDAFTITPSILYKGMNAQNELSVQALAGFQIDKEKELDLNMGLGYRITDADALEILFGVDWGDFRAGFGYDLGMSSVSSSSSTRPGAVEIAASYIAKIYKKPDPKPSLFCPRF